MKITTIIVVGVLLAAAFSLTSALLTRDGVGAVEYVVGFAVVAGLLTLAVRQSRRALQRG